MNHEIRIQKIKELLDSLKPEELELLFQVIEAEQEKLHMGNPIGIKDDIEQIVRRVIK